VTPIDTNTTTDYSVSTHWLSLPVGLKKTDVFYVYPTVWYKTSDYHPNVCAVDYQAMMLGAQNAFAWQATAFEAAGNVFAPFYRQCETGYIIPFSEDKRWEHIREYPLKDVTAAFEYYLDHFNNKRPFILAGHSQGAMVLLALLSDYMSVHPDVYQRMIAAYVIGYPVTDSLMRANPHLKFAQGPDDTGVIISYNTQSPKIKQGENPVVAYNVGKVINPISWSRDTAEVPASQNLGSLAKDSTGQFIKVLNVADAKIDPKQGVLICSSVKDSSMWTLSQIMPLGVYHIFDYNFYYFNIQENAIRRVNKFLGKK
jgi:pimeloyl-ACP methyl ester carboxylesterase